MKSPSESLSRSVAQLDRLVDGELAGAEYQELLAQLDGHPELWRCCALAFLEAQAWRQQLSELAAPQGCAIGTLRSGQGASPGRWWTWSVAASVLLAFAGGVLAGGAWYRGPSSSAPLAAARPSSQPAVNRDSAVDGATLGELAQSARQPLDKDPQPQPVGNVQLLWEDLASSQIAAVDVDLFAAGEGGVERLFSPQSILPPELLRELERSGHQVRVQRHLVPVPLDDQQAALVPVEQMEVLPVSHPIWQ